MRNFFIILGLAIFLIFVGWWLWKYEQSPLDPNGKTVAFVINKGEGISSIADRLEKENIIQSSTIFKLVVKFSGQGGNIQAGDYKVSPSESDEEIIKTFRQGTMDMWVTLLEGWRNEEVAGELNKKLGSAEKEFLSSSKEGYMFPDTYLFNPKATVQTIIQILQNNFNKKYDESLQSKVRTLGLTPEQGVVLASIVEREGRSPGVRQKVASILLKRLKIGMALNADATIQYALGYQRDQKSWWKKGLSLDDLKIASPYNTYLHPGLPPTPICNPGLSSLEAVANADPSTPYLYYYHDSKGNSYYAKTLEEHNKNVAEYP